MMQYYLNYYDNVPTSLHEFFYTLVLWPLWKFSKAVQIHAVTSSTGDRVRKEFVSGRSVLL